MRILRFRQRAKENVDWCSAGLEADHIRHVQVAVDDRQALVRRDHVGVIRFQLDALGDLRDRNSGNGLQDFGEEALVFGRKVKNDDVGVTGRRGNVPEKLLQDGDAAG